MTGSIKIAPDQVSDHEYECFKELIASRTGLVFGQQRHEALRRGVCAAANRAGSSGLDVFYRGLQQLNTDHPMWDDLISELTIGETYFFRNKSHMEALRHHIIPKLVDAHKATRRLRIWSAGCASGEEPYSLAILLHQLMPDIASWNIQILATDINRRVLESAKAASYRAWSFREIYPGIQEKYFIQENDTYKLLPQIRKLVTFAYLNLAENSFPSLTTNTNAMDLILCRNVAIYLPEAVNRAIAKRFYQSIAANGWLIMGASETNMDIYRDFRAHYLSGATVYQKISGTGKLSWPAKSKKVEQISLQEKGEQLSSPRETDSISTPQISEPVPQPVQVVSKPEQRDRNYQHALAEIQAGHSDKAQHLLLACIEEDPQFSLAYYQIARLQANAGYLTRAQDWLQQALSHDPLMIEAHYTLGLVFQEKGEIDQAVAQLKKILFLNPDFILAHFGLSVLYQQNGQAQLADRHRAQAIRIASRLPADAILFSSDGLSAGRALRMMQTYS